MISRYLLYLIEQLARPWLMVVLIVGVLLILIRQSPKARRASFSGSLSEELRRNMSPEHVVRLDFEVFGTVQGVFFRKYTQQEANKLGIRGFCRNTSNGTVSGTLEGPRKAVDQMKDWLEKQGSPMSTISKAVFKNEVGVDRYSFDNRFEIARTV